MLHRYPFHTVAVLALILPTLLTGCGTQQALRVQVPVSAVEVLTVDEKDAGTNADVLIQIFGNNWSTAPFELDNSKNNFERGETDVFDYPGMPVEPANRIKIWLTTDKDQGWKLGQVTLVLNSLCGDVRRQPFQVNRWLDSDEGDRVTCIYVDTSHVVVPCG